jgi:hypothetical protein
MNCSRTRATVALVVLMAVSCTKASPAGFWTAYRPELIRKRHSDQGPWGGTRWISWQSEHAGTFTASDAARFAASHGWSCQEPTPHSAEQMKLWQYSGKPVFVLPFGPASQRPDNHGVEQLPRFIDDDSITITCTSGWVRVKPGSDRTTPAYGYIHMNTVGTRMTVYHLWGEQ